MNWSTYTKKAFKKVELINTVDVQLTQISPNSVSQSSPQLVRFWIVGKKQTDLFFCFWIHYFRIHCFQSLSSRSIARKNASSTITADTNCQNSMSQNFQLFFQNYGSYEKCVKIVWPSFSCQPGMVFVYPILLYKTLATNQSSYISFAIIVSYLCFLLQLSSLFGFE